jgi:hypothetical protein
MRFLTATLALVALTVFAAADEKPGARPMSPEEAGKHVGEKVTVEMVVKASKDRLEKRKEIYLDSTTDHHDPKNLAAVITVSGAARLRSAGVTDPAAHYLGKTIRVSGTVTLKEKEPRIEINDAGQIRIVEKKKD